MSFLSSVFSSLKKPNCFPTSQLKYYNCTDYKAFSLYRAVCTGVTMQWPTPDNTLPKILPMLITTKIIYTTPAYTSSYSQAHKQSAWKEMQSNWEFSLWIP